MKTFPNSLYKTISTEQAWDLDNASYANKSHNFTMQSSGNSGIWISNDGTKLNYWSYNTNYGYNYTLNPAWDISTASYNGSSFNWYASFGKLAGACMSSDGTKVFIARYQDTLVIYRFTCTTAWDVTTMQSTGTQSFSVSSYITTPACVFLSPDGYHMYVTDGANNDVTEYSLTTAWDISSGVSYVRTQSVSTYVDGIRGIFFYDDGTRCYIISNTGTYADYIIQYNLSTAWNISTMSYDTMFSIGSQSTSPSDLFFKSGVDYFYITGYTPDSSFQYNI